MKLACSEAMRVVQASARLAPAPAAGPLTAAITGFGMVAMARMIRFPSFSSASISVTSPLSRAFRRSSTSPPAQNPRPAPVSTTARTALSCMAPHSASSKAWPRALFNALRRSGRFNVIVDTEPRRDSNTSGAKLDPEAIVKLPPGRINQLYVQEGSIGQAVQHLGKLAEVTQSDSAIVGGLCSRGRQDEEPRAIELFRLQTKIERSLGELFVCILAIERDHAGRIFFEFLCQ